MLNCVFVLVCLVCLCFHSTGRCEWQPHDDADCRDQEAKLNFRETCVVTVVIGCGSRCYSRTTGGVTEWEILHCHGSTGFGVNPAFFLKPSPLFKPHCHHCYTVPITAESIQRPLMEQRHLFNGGSGREISNCSITCRSKTFDLPQRPSALQREQGGLLKVEGRAESKPADQFRRIRGWALVCNVWRRHVVNHLALLFDPLEWERRRGRGSADSLYSHLLINGGHHRHLTRLIDLHSLQGLCCVSISYWLFQVYSFSTAFSPS